jgi:TRAP-type mannitol/chloroaromatic compound transport system permease small subunit
MVHRTAGNAHLPGDAAAVLGLAVSLGSAAFGGAAAGNGLLAGFGLALVGALLGGRGAIVFMTLALTTGLWFAVPSGANATLTALGFRPRDVWRNFMPHTHFAASAVVLLVFAIGLLRRGPTPSRAAVETADDIESIVTAIGKAASWLFIPMMVFIFYDITQRTIVNNYPGFLNTPFAFPSAKMQEMQWHLHGALFMLCLGFAYVADAHVRIELVRDKLSPRTRVWLELLGSALFLFAYCAVLVRFGFTFTERAFNTGEASAAPTGLSDRWIIKSMLPLGFVILGMTGVASVLRCLVYLFGPETMKPLTNRYAGTHHADLPADVATRGPITD